MPAESGQAKEYRDGKKELEESSPALRGGGRACDAREELIKASGNTKKA